MFRTDSCASSPNMWQAVQCMQERWLQQSVSVQERMKWSLHFSQEDWSTVEDFAEPEEKKHKTHCMCKPFL